MVTRSHLISSLSQDAKAIGQDERPSLAKNRHSKQWIRGLGQSHIRFSRVPLIFISLMVIGGIQPGHIASLLYPDPAESSSCNARAESERHRQVGVVSSESDPAGQARRQSQMLRRSSPYHVWPCFTSRAYAIPNGLSHGLLSGLCFSLAYCISYLCGRRLHG